ncbi:MAG: hypothetical protein OSJ60_01825 [Lachnospiraceae bacterium]|nr:hypothetical protein C819_02259 [Lachnospiraceae bacterium 10-1]MCX4350351.1 hypothetical protein [Lachnospiraceae bacterium]
MPGKELLSGKALLDKLYDQPELFKYYMRNKRWAEAKSRYDTTRDVLLFLQADEEMLNEFFGERGERGVILREGLFPEDEVQKAFYEAVVKRDGGYENKNYEPLQKNSA